MIYNLVIYLMLYNFSPHYAQTFQGFKLRRKSYQHTESINGYNHKLHNLSYNLNKHRKNNNFDYDYNWDDNEEAAFKRDYTEITITDKSNVTTVYDTTTAIADTNVSDIIKVENDTQSILNLNITDTVNPVAKTEETSKTIASTGTTSSPVTRFTFPEETEKLLDVFITTHSGADTSSPPSLHFETYFPGNTQDFLDHTVTRSTTTKNPFYEDIKEISNEKGRFTSSLIVLFKMLVRKNPNEIMPLIVTLNSRIQVLNDEDKMLIFGGMAAEVFQAMLQMLGSEPTDVMQDHFKYAEYALENKHTVLKRDVNGLIDIVDTVYIETDIDNIANLMRDIKRYPNGTKTDDEIIEAAIQDYMYAPFRRIHDTAREKLLVVELNNVIKRRLYPGEDLENKRRQNM
ncbi:uncharacterized protein LOC126780009 [Nymphalis io]|uniref:uncharacterized protein LOC126780009 n=1 Tax=Inachis io TaxID=171585 RepID=UPI002168368D|nr:uncharacterized protein LOC126780009 [Nymphalis io]